MKATVRAVVCLCALLGGCSLGSGVEIDQPDIAIAQLPGTALAMQYRGTVTVPFLVEVTNNADEPIKIESLELWTIGDGPYTLQGPEVKFHTEIDPEETWTVQFSMPAFSEGGSLAPSHPVTIRGSAFFDSPSGRFRKVFTQQVRQPAQEGKE